MPPALPPTPLGPDPDRAEAAARALADLAEDLGAAARGLGWRASAAIPDWHGFSRTWFDHRHAEVEAGLRRGATAAAQAAAAIRAEVAATNGRRR